MILFSISLGKVVEIRALPHSPTSKLNLHLYPSIYLPSFSTDEFSLLQNIENLSVCLIITLLIYSRIFLEFCPLNLSTSSVFSSQLVYSHHYLNNIFLIFKKTCPLTQTLLQLLYKVSALYIKNTLKEFSILIVYIPLRILS